MADLNDIIDRLTSGQTQCMSTLETLLAASRGLEDESTKKKVEETLSQLRTQVASTPTSTIIGFFGVTGHGKSSIINALLPGVRLPTSDSNACTPVPIVVESKEGEGIELQVSFLEQAEFEAQRKLDIENLFAKDEFGSSEETEARVDNANRKIKAIYPKVNARSFDTPEDLENHLGVLDGENGVTDFIQKGTIEILCNDSSDFAQKIQNFGSSAGVKCNVLVELWPIVKVINVKVANELLKQGLVLKDIPGTMDTDLARSEVAGRELKKCTHPLILASCDRAVDSPDVWDRIGEMLWHDRVSNERSKILIVLTQIDKGTKEEGERHVETNVAYRSLQAELIVAEEHLSVSRQDEQIEETVIRQIQEASAACVEILVFTASGRSVREPPWWSKTATLDWAKTSTVSFTAELDGHRIDDSAKQLDMETILAKNEELKEYSERTTTSKQSLELAKEVLNLKQQMRYLRTDAKINAIRIKIVEKVATKLAEQACTLAHNSGDDYFDTQAAQPTAFIDLATTMTTVVGVCAPAAVAINHRNSGMDADPRYEEWSDIESTGVPSLERLLTTLVDERLAEHKIRTANHLTSGLLQIQLMGSFGEDLSGAWWASNGQDSCDTLTASIEKKFEACNQDLHLKLKGVIQTACEAQTDEAVANYISGDQLRKVVDAFLDNHGKLEIYRTRVLLQTHVSKSFSGFHTQVIKMSTTQDSPENSLLRLCAKVNKRQQEIYNNHIDGLIKCLTEEIILLQKGIIQSEVKKEMDVFYVHVRSLTEERKAAIKRKEKVIGQITTTLENELKAFLAKEAKNILVKVGAAVQAAIAKAIDQTMGSALRNSTKNKTATTISQLNQTYSQAFLNFKTKGRTNQNDIAILKSMCKESIEESKRLNEVILKVQEMVPTLKRDAEEDLSSASKRPRGTSEQPIEIDDD